MLTTQFDFDNVSGIAHIYAIPAEDVLAITVNPLTGLYRIALKKADGVIVIPTHAQEATSFEEPQEDDDGTPQYNVSISVFFPRFVNPLIEQTLERGSWLVAHQDANGDILLSGTTDIPLLFRSHRQTAAGAPSGNQGEFYATEPICSYHLDNRAFYL